MKTDDLFIWGILLSTCQRPTLDKRLRNVDYSLAVCLLKIFVFQCHVIEL